ncbi:hypothetical protein EVAR_79652_1 [Eumeta japonica]|uniref:Uncharacterized protein n=1 Tax=Eumeta variegata TaxID=151549 RepID=A0A4C1W9T1_EUMVA|nr:hypothetical protein EVAR_79652_1 [Eumeta japonica]
MECIASRKLKIWREFLTLSLFIRGGGDARAPGGNAAGSGVCGIRTRREAGRGRRRLHERVGRRTYPLENKKLLNFFLLVELYVKLKRSGRCSHSLGGDGSSSGPRILVAPSVKLIAGLLGDCG